MPELRATVRLQLHRDFTFADAAATVPYYAALGISHFYLSPIAQARPSSVHGYDVLDPTRISAQLGSETGFRRLLAVLRKHGMGAIADIVPNHMAADVANPWWADVLACGQRSAFAHFFDIDWDAPGLRGKLGLPLLSRPLDEALENPQLQLRVTPERLELECCGQLLPVSAQSMLCFFDAPPQPQEGTRDEMLTRWRQTAAQPVALARLHDRARSVSADRSAMRRFLEQQHYALLAWKGDSRSPNYRRFFDINDLAALSVERQDVFDAVHALPLRLVAEGLLDGLRIDHVDGLSTPGIYLRQLRNALDAATQRSGLERVPVYVEKILATGESLRVDWPVEGTTGYDFMGHVGALLHDPHGEAVLREAWQNVAPEQGDFDQVERCARQLLLATSLAPELQRLARGWKWVLPANDGDAAAHEDISHALAGPLEHMPVYRTYLVPGKASATDRAVLALAFQSSPPKDAPLERQHHRIHAHLREDTEAVAQESRRRFEQTAAALNAKAVEDTAFYRYGALLSRNEVGGDPRYFALSPQAFHTAMLARAGQWPASLSATATHDHKRGEDNRARLAVLSERAAWFAERARTWRDMTDAGPLAPVAADLWILFQTILGAYPLDMDRADGNARQLFARRLAAWQTKALREAKLRSSWMQPDRAYESACEDVIRRLCAAPGDPLADSVAAAARTLDVPGAFNALAATTLRVMAPGIPDLYQGADRWDQSLVDPDNRQPVDYAIRRASVSSSQDLGPQLLTAYRDGAVKQWLIGRLLACRARCPGVFSGRTYRAVQVSGEHAAKVVAFIRSDGIESWLIAVPRLCADLLADRTLPLVDPEHWETTLLHLPVDDAACTYRDAITGHAATVRHDRVSLANLWSEFPVAVLELHRQSSI